MRGAPIIVPRLQSHVEKSKRAHRMLQQGAKEALIGSDDEYEVPAIEGLACVYGKLLTFKGQLTVFSAGCFGAIGHTAFQIDHDEKSIVGDTRTGLELHDCADGLAFRFRVPQTQLGSITHSVVKARDRASMSVGCEILADEVHNCAGKDVRFITRAKLKEISLVRRGAVTNTFATVVDARTAPPLRDAVARSNFMLLGSLQRLSNLVKDTGRTLNERVEKLSLCADRLEAMSKRKGPPPPIDWTLLQQRRAQA